MLKSLLIFSLILSLVFGYASDALAARSGGRIGGGSFRSAPRSRTYTSPRGGYQRPGGYGYGGGFGFPFLLPFFGFGSGFGGLFSILIFIAIANFLVKTIRNLASDNEGQSLGSTKISVGKVQVGLLATARYLQDELNQLGQTADTGTAAGRAQVLQESTLALLRHPEYWVYGTAESQKAGLDAAEAKFNQLALAERSKFSYETLTNVNAQLRQAQKGSLVKQESEESGEYIVATIVVGTQGNLELPKINSTEDLQQALRTIGSLGSDRLLAIEILWTPQAQGDTLTTDDILSEYPDLKLV
ncbi:MAG: DUF1517 domain-containing protein [Okeania sp. SIO2D1]|nr:DUF1517 domain-containing protein [Okeania sp. SIO2D1]